VTGVQTCALPISYFFGTGQQPIVLPSWLRGSVELFGIRFGNYRIFLIVVSLVITALLFFTLERTRFGAKIRAAVDNQRVAQALGLTVERSFAVPFSVGPVLAVLLGSRI